MNKRILILSGPTHEYLDPVRFIGNASSGLMGKAIAEEALDLGCFVDMITGPVPGANLPVMNSSGSLHPVVSADEMLKSAARLFPSADAAVFAAAVADYAPAEKQAEKLAKSDEELVLRLRPTPDIAASLGRLKQPGQITIGFALQTSDGKLHAAEKLQNKHLDGIVLNTPDSIAAPTGSFSFLAAGTAGFEEWGIIGKNECARRIMQAIARLASDG